MDKYTYKFLSDYIHRMEGAADGQTFYDAEEADARIAELEAEIARLKGRRDFYGRELPSSGL